MSEKAGLCWRRCFLCSSPVDEVGGGGYGVGVEGQIIIDGVKLVMKYLLHDFKLEEVLAKSVIAQWWSGGGVGEGIEADGGSGGGAPGGARDFTPRLCTYCRSLVGSISKLQLELEMIQMRMVSGLEDLKKAVISNSRLYGGNDGVKQDFEELEETLLRIETYGGDSTSGRRFLDVIHHFQTFVFENDSKHQHIPLLYLERFTGKKINATLSDGLNLERAMQNLEPPSPVFLNTDNIKEEPHDYYPEPTMEEADLPSPLPNVKTEAPTPTTTSGRRRGRKSAQLASARLSQTLKKIKCPKEPKKKISEAQLLYRDIRRKNYSKKLVGGRRKPKNKEYDKSRRCDECGLSMRNTNSYTLEQHFKQHEETTPEERNYECPDCKIPFRQKQYFELHLSFHARVHQKCDICGQSVHLADLEAHLKAHHQEVKIFRCGFCIMVCPTFEALAKHLSSHKKVSVKCELCSEEDSTKYEVHADLRRHLAESHGKDQLVFKCTFDGCSQVFYNSSALLFHRNVHLRLHVCSVCDKSLGSSVDLERHTRLEHPAKVTVWYPCDACDQKFLTDTILLRHQILVHNKPKLKCELCPLEFISKDACYRHVRQDHKVGKTFNCRHCGKSLRDKSHWRRHEARHTREKNFTCEICGFATHTSEWLSRHKEIHDEKRERKYPCPHCDMRFYDDYTLVNHIRRHTGERPYQCDECGATFTQKSALNTHSKRHVDGKVFVPSGPRRSSSGWKKIGQAGVELLEPSSSVAQNCEARDGS